MITKTFDKDPKAIFNPEDAYNPNPKMPEVCLVTFTNKVIDILKERFETEVIGHIDGEEGLPVYRFTYKGKKLAVYRVTMGAAGVVALMEEARILGAKKFIYFGSCGTLDNSIPAGHIIVPDRAYRDEGTSYHYADSSSDWIEVRTAERTYEMIKSMGFDCTRCSAWTTDALYRETRTNMDNRVRQGCKVVDMECSAIHACAEFRRYIDCYQFFYAEDNLDAIKWEPRIAGHTPKTSYELIFDIALEMSGRI